MTKFTTEQREILRKAVRNEFDARMPIIVEALACGAVSALLEHPLLSDALERAAEEIEHGHAWISNVAASAIIRKHAASTAPARQLTDDDIKRIARTAYASKELLHWSGFELDELGFYSQPIISESVATLIRIVLREVAGFAMPTGSTAPAREPPPEPKPLNESGSTISVIRWMVDLPSGKWLGAWDKSAFAEYLGTEPTSSASAVKCPNTGQCHPGYCDYPKCVASSAPARVPLTAAARDVLAERQRQISAEGWTPEHDDEHNEGELAYAAAGYAAAVSHHLQAVKHEFDGPGEPTLDDIVTQPPLDLWPHGWEFKPAPARRLLVKAGALILAEIDRLDRAITPTGSTAPAGSAEGDAS